MRGGETSEKTHGFVPEKSQKNQPGIQKTDACKIFSGAKMRDPFRAFCIIDFYRHGQNRNAFPGVHSARGGIPFKLNERLALRPEQSARRRDDTTDLGGVRPVAARPYRGAMDIAAQAHAQPVGDERRHR